MTIIKFFLILAVVAGIAFGQILFKISSRHLAGDVNWTKFLFSPTLIGAFILYAGFTFLWVYLLRDIDLSKAYPLFALSFVLVPFLSWLLLGEGLNKYALYGAALIIAGVYVSFME